MLGVENSLLVPPTSISLPVRKNAVVSATPAGAEALRRSGLSTVVACLVPTAKSLVDDILQRKQETPERLALMRQAATLFHRLPESAYDLVVRVKSLAEAEAELEDKLRAYVELH